MLMCSSSVPSHRRRGRNSREQDAAWVTSGGILDALHPSGTWQVVTAENFFAPDPHTKRGKVGCVVDPPKDTSMSQNLSECPHVEKGSLPIK